MKDGVVPLLASNLLLALYPTLLKKLSDVSTFSQLYIRLLTIIIACFPFLSSFYFSWHHIIISFINLLHIYTSYIGFQALPSGIALTIFYTYPLFLLLLTKQYTNPYVAIGIIFSLIGVWILTYSNNEDNKGLDKKGIIAVVIAAITEAIIIMYYHTQPFQNSFDRLFTLYIWAAIPILIWGWSDVKKDVGVLHWGWPLLIALHLCLGFVGYLLRLHSISISNMVTFAGLSFSTVIFGFIMDYLVLGKSIESTHLLGSLLILIGMTFCYIVV